MELNGCEVHIVRSYDPAALAWPALALVVVIGGSPSDLDHDEEAPPAGKGAVIVTVSSPRDQGPDGGASEPLSIVDIPALIHRMLDDVTTALRDRSSLAPRDRQRDAVDDAVLKRLDRLTRKQREVLQRLMEGMTLQEIAADLCISVSTTRGHLRGMFQQLRVSNQLAAAVIAYKAGWPIAAFGRPD